MRIDFYPREKQKLESYIELIVRIEKGVKVVKHGIGEKVAMKDWDFAKKQCKANSPNATLNDILSHYKLSCAEFIRAHKRTYKKNPTRAAVKYFLVNLYTNVEDNQQTFLEFVDELIETRKNDEEKYCDGTIMLYNRTLRFLKEYTKSTSRKLAWESFNFDFGHHFQQYLLGRKYSANYVTSIWKKFTMFLLEAHQADLYDIKELNKSKLSRTYDEADTIALEMSEIMAIHNKHIEDEYLTRHKDAFVINCHLGLRYGDYSKIRKEDIMTFSGEKVLRRKTGKTNTMVFVPVSTIVEEIMKKYDGDFPKVGSNDDWNKALKVIALSAKLTDNVVKIENQGGNDIEKIYEKWQLVTVHTSRRSFATMLNDLEVDIYTIAEFLGHKDVKTTKKYIKSDSRTRAVKMSKLPFFRGEGKGKVKTMWG